MSESKKYIKTSFAGANTASGFVSFYDNGFSEELLDGLYIIKGGPGTGKSTFMRRLGDIAIKNGYTVEHYLCGSDAGSLDGVIIVGKRRGRIGVIDGTPPHPREFRSPGAAGDILNFGQFWSSGDLRKSRRDIDSLVREKQGYFDTAYRYLGAAGKIDSHITSICNKMYLKEKAIAAADKLVCSIGYNGNAKYRQLSGYTMKGEVSLCPTNEAREMILIGDRDIARIFLGDMENSIKMRGISAEISLSPLHLRSADSIYFPESNVWVKWSAEKNEKAEKIINMQRFTDKNITAEYRQRLRFGKKCRRSLMDGTFESFAGAKEKHFKLEEIYKEYMDFDALQSQSELWYNEILSRLD